MKIETMSYFIFQQSFWTDDILKNMISYMCIDGREWVIQ